MTKPLSAAPTGMRLLACWLDLKNPGDADPEIQDDLRHWADLIEALIDATLSNVIADMQTRSPRRRRDRR